MDLRLSATAVVATERAERLAKQLVSHWGRHSDPSPEADGDATMMRFPADDGGAASAVRVAGRPHELRVVVWGEGEDDLQATCNSLVEHLQRWAGEREILTVSWDRTDPGD